MGAREQRLEGDWPDTYRNILRDYFYQVWLEGKPWDERQLIQHLARIPKLNIPHFLQWYHYARRSRVGKIGWIDHINRANQDDWDDYTKLLAPKFLPREQINKRKGKKK